MIVRRSCRAAVIAVGCLVSLSAFAADAKKGETIAARWCSACHLVTKGQKSASADVPTFADIARRRADAKALGNFLVDPHPKMPDLHLSRGEIDDIVAYIRSLDPRPSAPGEPEVDRPPRPNRG